MVLVGALIYRADGQGANKTRLYLSRFLSLTLTLSLMLSWPFLHLLFFRLLLYTFVHLACCIPQDLQKGLMLFRRQYSLKPCHELFKGKEEKMVQALASDGQLQ